MARRRFFQDQRELVPAQAGNGIFLTQALLETVCSCLQHRIPKGVAICVVNRFEVVEIQHQKSKSAVVT